MIGRAVLVRTAAAAERVAGLTLLERAERTARRAGVSRIDVADRAPTDEPVLVIDTDRIYDPSLVARLVSEARPTACFVDGRACGLAVTGPSPRRLDVPPGQALPADSAAARVDAERALFQALRKPVDGFVSRHLNRHLSIAVTRLLLPTGVTPNQMTVVAALIGVAGVLAVCQATWAGVAAGAFLVQLQSVLDGCDGEIARLKLQSSRFGEWLDNVTDDIVNAGFGAALGYAASVLLGQPLWLWLGLAAAAAISIYNAVVYAQLIVHHRGTGNPFAFRWWYQRDERSVHSRMTGPAAVLYALVRRDTFLLAFMLLAFARLPHVAVLWYAIVSSGYLLMTIIHAACGGMPIHEKAA